MTTLDLTTSDPAAVSIEALEGSPRRHRRETFTRSVLFGAALFSVLVSFLIIYALFAEAWIFIRDVDWAVTWGEIGWFPRRGVYDIPTLLVASFWTTAPELWCWSSQAGLLRMLRSENGRL